MYTAKIENSTGDTLTLTQNESNFQIVSITGLNPPPAQVNTTPIAGLDGAVFNSAKLNTRNIVIMIKINGDIEANRQRLYNLFRTKEQCTFYFQNENRDVYIEGYIETCEVDLFSNGETMQVSIVCPQPYFKAIDEIITDISSTVAAFVFPFSINIGSPIAFSNFDTTREVDIYNASESETGIQIQIYCDEAVSTIEIKNTTTGDNFELNYAFEAGDQILINTNKGQKSVKLIRNGITSNLFSALQKGSVFFQLQVGDNNFSYLADNGTNNDHVFITFAYFMTYRGV